MNNLSVENELISCDTELNQIDSIITDLGLTSRISPYLSMYAVIRACGAIETAFKSLIADFVSRRGKRQVKRFVSRRIREASANPRFDNMCKFLHDFDEDWKASFKDALNCDPNKSVLLDSLQSLVDARNAFAHGGSPTASIADVIRYFGDSRKILEKIDSVIG